MEIPALEAPDRAALRRTVFALRQRDRRRSFPAHLHVGDPDGPHVSYAVEGDRLDAGLRTDVVAALLRSREGDRPALWLTRPGRPEPHDLDRLWLPPALAACAEAGLRRRWFVVVTKAGWYDPLGGTSVTWKRLRIR